jgi:glutathione-specific gamma-glutamylcyclotransferase
VSEHGLWVFGYGSLMWRPGFPHDEAVHAILAGAHRALCVYSHVHRGTPRLPGLVLGLDAGGRCEGIAYNVPARHVQRTLNYLRRREQQNNVYRPVFRSVTLQDEARREVRALCYFVRRDHRQYAGRLPLEIQAQLVRRSRGKSGRNIDYVMNTLRHLRECGICDEGLEALVTRFGRHRELRRGVVQALTCRG